MWLWRKIDQEAGFFFREKYWSGYTWCFHFQVSHFIIYADIFRNENNKIYQKKENRDISTHQYINIFFNESGRFWKYFKISAGILILTGTTQGLFLERNVYCLGTLIIYQVGHKNILAALILRDKGQNLKWGFLFTFLMDANYKILCILFFYRKI